MAAVSSFISRRKRRTAGRSNFRAIIASKKAALLRSQNIGVIGAELTGRNTLVRRFLHMSDGPFERPEFQKYTRRSVLVDLSERPNILQNDVVRLKIHIMNARCRSYEHFYQSIPDLQTIAIVFDVSEERSLDIAISCMNRIRQHLENSGSPPFVLIGNKIDMPVSGDAMASVRQKARDAGAEHYFECSAQLNCNVAAVLDAILLLSFCPDRLLPQ